MAAGEPTRAYPEPVLANPAPAPGPAASVPPNAVTRQPVAVSRYQLSGVMASTAAGGPGVALIAVNGAAARAIRVGAPVDGDLVLKEVSQGGAALGPANGPATVMLEVNYGANPTSPVQLASASRTPASFGAQALPSVEPPPRNPWSRRTPIARCARQSQHPPFDSMGMQWPNKSSTRKDRAEAHEPIAGSPQSRHSRPPACGRERHIKKGFSHPVRP